MKALYEPKSKKFPDKIFRPLTDCSSPTPMIDFSQYFAPISVYQGAMKIAMENEVLKAVQQIGVSVDKEELLRALANDRKQYEHGYIKGYQAGYAASKWISVEERLPEEGFEVLIMFKHNMAVGWYDGEFGWYSNTDDGFYASCDGEPTHWMPLPEPPGRD